jgi:hypothetical protein
MTCKAALASGMSITEFAEHASGKGMPFYLLNRGGVRERLWKYFLILYPHCPCEYRVFEPSKKNLRDNLGYRGDPKGD